MANRREEAVKEEARKLGWEVLRNGWPDFLLYNKYTNEAIFLEVKSKNKTGKLSPDQKRMHKVLRQLGLDVRIVKVGKDIHSHKKRIQEKIHRKAK